MTALEAILALTKTADRLGLSEALRTIISEAVKEHPELVPPPPPGSKDAIDADIDAELARLGLKRIK